VSTAKKQHVLENTHCFEKIILFIYLAALKFCFKTCVAMKFVDDDDDDDDIIVHMVRTNTAIRNAKRVFKSAVARKRSFRQNKEFSRQFFFIHLFESRINP